MASLSSQVRRTPRCCSRLSKMAGISQGESFEVENPVFRPRFFLTQGCRPFHCCLITLQECDVISEDRSPGAFEPALRGPPQAVLCFLQAPYLHLPFPNKHLSCLTFPFMPSRPLLPSP